MQTKQILALIPRDQLCELLGYKTPRSIDNWGIEPPRGVQFEIAYKTNGLLKPAHRFFNGAELEIFRATRDRKARKGQAA